jgi:nanoRNase/pAp phosphatase (c-di-AMP/oligoRNAs hydrolase)
MHFNGNLDRFKLVMQNAPPLITIIESHRDPDSTGCADHARSICELLGKSVRSFAAGEPGRRMNEAIIESFHINASPLERFTPKEKDFIILVDTPSPNDARLKVAPPFIPNIIIDHHKRPTDLTPEDDSHWYLYYPCGACCSLTAKMMLELGMEFSKDKPDHRATLGVLGILTDTSSLTSMYTTQFDREMVAALGHYADQKRINEMFFSTIDEEFLDIIHMATDPNIRKRGRITYLTYVKELPPAFEQYLETVADMLVKTKGITISWVWSIIDNHVVGKVRNTERGYPLDKRIKEVFGEANGGARDDNSMGKFIYDLGKLGKTKEKEGLISAVKSWLEQELLR